MTNIEAKKIIARANAVYLQGAWTAITLTISKQQAYRILERLIDRANGEELTYQELSSVDGMVVLSI